MTLTVCVSLYTWTVAVSLEIYDDPKKDEGENVKAEDNPTIIVFVADVFIAAAMINSSGGRRLVLALQIGRILRQRHK